MKYQRYNEQDEKDVKDDLRNTGRGSGKATKT
jgi:hypothetical protein